MTLPTTLLWLDLETTGLDPQCHTIVEVAAVATNFHTPFDADLARGVHAIIGHRYWDSLDNDVVAMHASSGLLDACRRSDTTLDQAENLLISEFPFIEDDPYVLAGFSVHFDLAFLRKYMPVFSRRLSHRVYDVSAIRLECCSMGMPYVKGLSAHRAPKDVEAAIGQARECRRWLYTEAKAQALRKQRSARKRFRQLEKR